MEMQIAVLMASKWTMLMSELVMKWRINSIFSEDHLKIFIPPFILFHNSLLWSRLPFQAPDWLDSPIP